MPTVTEYTGMNAKVGEWIANHLDLLNNAEAPVTKCRATLTAGQADVNRKDGLQETAKTNLKNATIANDTTLHVRYVELSSMIDLLGGFVGKDSTEAAQLYAIRAEYTKAHQHHGAGPASSSSSSSTSCPTSSSSSSSAGGSSSSSSS